MRRQFLAAAFSAFVGPARLPQPALLQRVATIKDIPPVIQVNSEDRLPLSQGLFTGSVTINRLFNSAPTAATNTPVARRLGDRLADYVNVKDYGAALDGQTNDTNAIQAAWAAAGGRAVQLPAGTAAIATPPDALSGRFRGEGQLRTGDGFRRARMFARRSTEPARYGVLGDISTAFNPSYSAR
jgi:hypothetical protein